MSAELELRAMKGDDTLADRKRALQAARSTVAKDSKKYEDYTWLGHMALLAGEDAEAEKAFRRARDLNDKVPETWSPWLLLLARIDPKRAEVELTKAENRLAGPMPLVLASAYETLGQTEQSGKPFVTALFGNPYTATFLPDVPAILLTYDFYDRAERSAVRALAGEAPITGKLPISLPGLADRGAGLVR